MSVFEPYPGIAPTVGAPALASLAAQIASMQNNLAQQASITQPMSYGDNILRVKGRESVMQLAVRPNSRVVAFHESEDVFYYITTDASGYKTIRDFSFAEIIPEAEKPVEYVTMDEFNRFKEDILNGQQSIRSGSNNAGKQSRSWNYGSSGNGKTDNGNAADSEKSN